MAQNVKISKSVTNWSLLVGGALILLFVFRTVYVKNSSTTVNNEYTIDVTLDDVASLEKDLSELSKDPVAGDLAEFEKSMQ